MKQVALKISTVLGVFLLAIMFTSCETETAQEELTLETPTNFELIKENLDIYQASLNNRAASAPADTYFCSESGGGYTASTYVNHTVYLNDFYVPSLRSKPGNNNRYASWMTNLQDWLMHDFNDTNPSGSNSVSVNINFDVYGAGGGTSLDATDGNRAYNEFVCQMMDQLNISSVSQLANYKFDMSITVDYFLCCTGSSCCDPVLYASGVAYYN